MKSREGKDRTSAEGSPVEETSVPPLAETVRAIDQNVSTREVVVEVGIEVVTRQKIDGDGQARDRIESGHFDDTALQSSIGDGQIYEISKVPGDRLSRA
jgi:hypothetical protein